MAQTNDECFAFLGSFIKSTIAQIVPLMQQEDGIDDSVTHVVELGIRSMSEVERMIDCVAGMQKIHRTSFSGVKEATRQLRLSHAQDLADGSDYDPLERFYADFEIYHETYDLADETHLVLKADLASFFASATAWMQRRTEKVLEMEKAAQSERDQKAAVQAAKTAKRFEELAAIERAIAEYKRKYEVAGQQAADTAKRAEELAAIERALAEDRRKHGNPRE